MMVASTIFTVIAVLLNIITLFIIVTRLKFNSIVNMLLLNIPLILLSEVFKSDVAFWVCFGFVCVIFLSLMLFMRTDLHVDCYVRLRVYFIDDEAKLKELDSTLSPFENWWYKFWYRRD